MELALFPIAAILLLLSGTGAPAHLADGPGSPATLLRRLFTPGPARVAADQKLRAPTSSRARYNQHAPVVSAHDTDRLVATQIRVASQIAASPVYRTRFGVRSRAYLATAPPLA